MSDHLAPNGAPTVSYSRGGVGYWIVRSLHNGWVAQGASPDYNEAWDLWHESKQKVLQQLTPSSSMPEPPPSIFEKLHPATRLSLIAILRLQLAGESFNSGRS